MIFPSNRVRIMVATKPIDFRKGHDSLAAMVKNELRKDPFTGTVFVFRARKADRLKLLYWDGTGLVMAYKRLEEHTLHLACREGRADADEPCAVRGAVCRARLAAGSGRRGEGSRSGGMSRSRLRQDDSVGSFQRHSPWWFGKNRPCRRPLICLKKLLR